ncbi:hypothetical protein VTK26DRAFT_7199 [Humicola hyalothermophila]
MCEQGEEVVRMIFEGRGGRGNWGNSQRKEEGIRGRMVVVEWIKQTTSADVTDNAYLRRLGFIVYATALAI